MIFINATCGFAMINHFFCILCMQDLGIISFGGVANAAWTTVSGNISLPAKVTPYSEEKYLRVYLDYGWTGSYFGHNYFCTAFMLPANKKSHPYQCTIPGLTGTFGIRVETELIIPGDFESSMPVIHEYAYYNSKVSTTDQELAEQFPAGGTYLTKDIILIATQTDINSQISILQLLLLDDY